MFPQQPQQQFRTAGADVQIFYGSGGNAAASQRSWSKPPGVSHVYMMLIGGGGNGNASTSGGGSGAVTVWYGAAQHVPDSLVVVISAGNGLSTSVNYRAKSGTIDILRADGANTATAGITMSANEFAASGFFKSTAGQAGSTTDIAASATTFLSGGADLASNDVVANYGYDSTATDAKGYFQMQPIIVGVGGSGAGVGGIGCGGGVTGTGGPGLVLIASW
jgi:hypothetical protein